MTKLDLQIACQTENIPTKNDFKTWAHAAINEKNKAYEICVRIVDENESQALNFQFRKKNKPTNVLSFSYGKDALPLLGDLIICADVVTKEAKEQQKTLTAHWAHLTIHGTLHLLGYDHENEHDAEIMEKKETEILAQLGFANPYEIKD